MTNKVDRSRDEIIEIMKNLRDKSILTAEMVYEISPDGSGFVQTSRAVVATNFREGSRLFVMFDSWDEANEFKTKIESIT